MLATDEKPETMTPAARRAAARAAAKVRQAADKERRRNVRMKEAALLAKRLYAELIAHVVEHPEGKCKCVACDEHDAGMTDIFSALAWQVHCVMCMAESVVWHGDSDDE